MAHDLLAEADRLMYEAKGERTNHVARLRVRVENGSLVEIASSDAAGD